MTSPILFKEYIWLVNTIAKARRITFADIRSAFGRLQQARTTAGARRR